MVDSREQEAPKTTYLKDYRPPGFRVDHLFLQFDLDGEETRVTSRFGVERLPENESDTALALDGEDLLLQSIKLDGRVLKQNEYSVNDEKLVIASVPKRCQVEIENTIRPRDNTNLMGLYLSAGNFCTQCEAEGFRRITYFFDRPDVLTIYTVKIIADKQPFPVLLANGNLTGGGALDGGKHWAEWHDPFPKPTYLFALVAGNLAHIEDAFVTCSGRRVRLFIYTPEHNIDKCDHAMHALKRAMKWDEETYGREYDLDRYMIVAVDDFNMGAMENKGLNVFNSKYVLAKPETATDADYEAIDSVIGHEYFHNWSGNRVTCRDWFQLSLKEGFTVFRDQEFSADIASRGVKRIEDVNVLRTHQFREDAGPMAHPVRPASYLEINNFYTLTIYNKGAEVIRMLHTLLGAEGFRKGTDLYFERHDGQAVTCDDFVAALEDANGIELKQFKRWYSQAGTPVLDIERQYNAGEKTLRLKIRQSCLPTPGQEIKDAFHIPFKVALLDNTGKTLPLGKDASGGDVFESVLEIKQPEQQFEFPGIPHEPVPSVLRGFSAPVKINLERSDDELKFLMAHDSDPFNRWDAAQQLASQQILDLVNDMQSEHPLQVDDGFVQAFAKTLTQDFDDKSFQADALTLPSETLIAEQMDVIDPQAIHHSRNFLKHELATKLKSDFDGVHASMFDDGPYKIDAVSIGKRRLRNLCLNYLIELDNNEVQQLTLDQYQQARNMTDKISALSALANSSSAKRQNVLDDFYTTWKNESLVVDKWLSLQARSRLPETLQNVRELTRHEAFNIKNPNKVRSLIGSFCLGNPVLFHAKNGSGYDLLSEYVIAVDRLNPQVAARLAGGFNEWRRYDASRQKLMRRQLEHIAAQPKLSKDVYEIVSKTLNFK